VTDPGKPAAREPLATPPGKKAIDGLIAGPHTREAVDAFIASHSFPIVEGTANTLIHRGEADPGARGGAQPDRRGCSGRQLVGNIERHRQLAHRGIEPHPRQADGASRT
jgi:hypothetical protein